MMPGTWWRAFPICPCLTPVSYTHLDVYKRQVRVEWDVDAENFSIGANQQTGSRWVTRFLPAVKALAVVKAVAITQPWRMTAPVLYPVCWVTFTWMRITSPSLVTASGSSE